MRLRCPYCRKNLNVRNEAAGRQAECPECGGRITVPAVSAEGLSKTCPECNAQINAKAVLCVKCGYSFKTRRRFTSEQKVPDRHVDSPLMVRGIGAAIACAAAALGIVVALVTKGDELTMPFAFGVAVPVMAFASFWRIQPTTAEDGKRLIKKTTFVCLVPVKKSCYDPSTYDALYISHSRGFMGSPSLTSILLIGGLLSWLLSDVFTLRLGRGVLLYRGHSEDTMREMTTLIPSVTDLRCERKDGL